MLLYRRRGGGFEVLLVHPGGPLWAKKDSGAWSIPKGECSASEDPLEAALREFAEETGIEPTGAPIPLTDLKQPGGKIVSAWAVEGDCNASKIRSNMFSMEWPPKSGKTREFPEIDRGEWFPAGVARSKILKGQRGFLEELELELSKGAPCAVDRRFDPG